jgi:hypothetical protein
MLTQDYLSHTLLPDNFSTEAYVESYSLSGGRIGYLSWFDDDPLAIGPESYYQGFAFGAFLHRRYGLEVDRQLISNCDDRGDELTSYQCVDLLIKRLGGTGFEDDFARVGATAFGLMSFGGVPGGFGYTPLNLEGYTLDFADTANGQPEFSDLKPQALRDGFLATAHSFERETIADGQTQYQRVGVKVPAGTTVMLVILNPNPVLGYP